MLVFVSTEIVLTIVHPYLAKFSSIENTIFLFLSSLEKAGLLLNHEFKVYHVKPNGIEKAAVSSRLECVVSP